MPVYNPPEAATVSGITVDGEGYASVSGGPKFKIVRTVMAPTAQEPAGWIRFTTFVKDGTQERAHHVSEHPNP